MMKYISDKVKKRITLYLDLFTYSHAPLKVDASELPVRVLLFRDAPALGFIPFSVVTDQCIPLVEADEPELAPDVRWEHAIV
jgi:hypothetical protein